MPADRTFVLVDVYARGPVTYHKDVGIGIVKLVSKYAGCLGGAFELDLGVVQNGIVRPFEDSDFTVTAVVSFNEEDLIPAVELLEGQIRCKCFYFTFGNKDGVIIPYKE